MKDAPPNFLQDVGYLPNAEALDYQYMICVVKWVTAIAARLNSKPVHLF